MPEYERIFKDLLAVEVTKMDRSLREEISKTISFLASRGTLQGSAAMQMIAKQARDALPVEAQMAMTLMLRSATAHGIQVNASNKEAIKELLEQHIKFREAELEKIVVGTTPFRSTHSSTNLLSDFHRQAELEVRRISGEIDLIAAANTCQRQADEGGSSSIIINGPVGLVQTGAGSFGIAHQKVDTESQNQIVEILRSIEKSLLDEGSNDKDVIELVADAKAEAEKQEPNNAKLKALVSGVGNAISLIPKLRESYDNLKWVGSLIGVNLP